MTEKDKMLAGELYNSYADKQLIKERITCKSLCAKHNQSPYKNQNARRKLLEKILGSHRENFTIEPSFWCDYGYNIEIGENFYSNHNLVILDVAKVKFGDNVLIGPNCGFYMAAHPLDVETRNSGLEFGKPITVGNNVWFGANVVVLPNVTIGDNCTIGAGSVVTKDVPPNSLAYGNPCRVVKNLS